MSQFDSPASFDNPFGFDAGQVFSYTLAETYSQVDIDPRDIARNPLGNRLMRHFPPRVGGRNLYKYADGSYDTVQRIPSIVNESTPPASQTVVHIYYGGHTGEEVSTAEAAALTAAGYGAYLT